MARIDRGEVSGVNQLRRVVDGISLLHGPRTLAPKRMSAAAARITTNTVDTVRSIDTRSSRSSISASTISLPPGAELIVVSSSRSRRRTDARYQFDLMSLSRSARRRTLRVATATPAAARVGSKLTSLCSRTCEYGRLASTRPVVHLLGGHPGGRVVSEVIAAPVGVVIGAGSAYLTERAMRRRERRGDAYTDAFAVLGAYSDHFLKVANDSIRADADAPVSDIDLHRVEFRVRLDGTADAFKRYPDALDAATRFHDRDNPARPIASVLGARRGDWPGGRDRRAACWPLRRATGPTTTIRRRSDASDSRRPRTLVSRRG